MQIHVTLQTPASLGAAPRHVPHLSPPLPQGCRAESCKELRGSCQRLLGILRDPSSVVAHGQRAVEVDLPWPPAWDPGRDSGAII